MATKKASVKKAVVKKAAPAPAPVQAQKIVVDEEHGHHIVMVPIDKIVANDYNPNAMDAHTFDALAQDMESIGVLSALLVFRREDGMYEIIDGEHRYEIAKLKDMKEVPCVVAEGRLSEDKKERMIQTMRMNKLRGVTDYRKLKSMVKELAEEYSLDEVAEKLLFTDANQLAAMIEETRTALPNDEMKKEFDKAKSELKTVDDLTSLIKRLFTKYGSDLRYHYMFMDYGGKDSVWIRIPSKKLFKQLSDKITLCKKYGVTADSAVLEVLMQHMTDAFFKKNAEKLDPADAEDVVAQTEGGGEDDGIFDPEDE